MGSSTEQRSRKEIVPTKPVLGLDGRPARHWLHRERRYHYPMEALGFGYGAFDVVLRAEPLQTSMPTTPEPEICESEQLQEHEEAMPGWLVAALCWLVIYLLFAYLWAIPSGWCGNPPQPGSNLILGEGTRTP